MTSQEEYYSSVEEIVEWICDGPILQPPTQPSIPDSCLPITIPSYVQPRDGPSLTLPVLPTPSLTPTTPAAPIGQPVPVAPVEPPQQSTAVPAPPSTAVPSRASSRKRKAIDFLKPLLHGKSYLANTLESQTTKYTQKQRVPLIRHYAIRQRVTQPEKRLHRLLFAIDPSFPFGTKESPTSRAEPYHRIMRRFHSTQRTKRNIRIGWCDAAYNLFCDSSIQLSGLAAVQPQTVAPSNRQQTNLYDRVMPTSVLPQVFPTRPLNLNEDGTTITYTKSHKGPNAAHWLQADSEEMARLFNSGTLRPILPAAIPSHKIATYVNPVCVEKSRDDGSLKFRTRATIGGNLLTYDGNTRHSGPGIHEDLA